MNNVTKKTRNHNTPKIEIKEDFVVQAPGHLIDIAIANKLTSVEWSLWMYLMRVNPFADCTSDGEPIYKDVPSPTDLAVVLGRDRKTIERAGRRLNDLGLYKLRVKSWVGFNETAAQSKRLLQERKIKKSSEGLNNSNQDNLIPNGTKKSQIELANPKKGLASPDLKAERLPDKGFDSSQTIQTSTYSPEYVEENIDQVATTQPLLAAAAVATCDEDPREEWDKEKAVEEILSVFDAHEYVLSYKQKQRVRLITESTFPPVKQRLESLKNPSSKKPSERIDFVLMGLPKV